MLAVVEDSLPVVRDNPLLQLVHSPLLVDVDTVRDFVREGGRRVRDYPG